MHCHDLVGACILVSKCAAGGCRQDVTGNTIVGHGNRGGGVAVIGLAGCRKGQSEFALGNGGAGGAGGRGQYIVGGIGTGQAGVLYRHDFVTASILVSKCAGRRCRQDIASNTIVGHGDRGGGIAVIRLSSRHKTQRQFALRDRGAGGAGGRAQHIVGGVGTGQAGILYCHHFVGASVLVGKRAGRRCCQDVAGNTIVGDDERGGGIAVIRLAGCRKSQSQFALGNGGAGGTGSRCQYIVGRIGTGQAGILYCHDFVAASILVGKCAGRRCCQDVAGNTVVGHGDRGGGAAVVGLAGCRKSQSQFALGNGGAGGAGGRAQHIVGGIGTGQAGVLHCHQFVGTSIFVGKYTAGGCRQDVTGNTVIGHGDRGGGVAVIGLAGCRKGQCQFALGDRGAGGTGGRAQHIVGSVGARQAGVLYCHGLVGAGVLVRKYTVRRCRQHVAGDTVVGDYHGSTRTAVIYLVDTDKRQAQAALRDIGRRGAASVHDGIVRRIRSRQAGIRHRHRLAAARILVGKCTGRRCRQHVARHAVIGHRHGRRRAAIVCFIGSGKTQVQGALRDIGGGGAAGIDQGVVGRVKTGQAGVLHRHRLAAAGVLVAKRAGRRCRQHIACHAVIGDCHEGRHAAIVRFIAACKTQVQGPLRDIGGGRAAGIAQRIVGRVKTGQAGIPHGHRLAAAGILVGKRAAGRRRQHVAGHAVIGHRHGRRSAAIVSLVDARKVEIERTRRDAGAGLAGAGIEHVIARIAAAQVAARHAVVDVLAGARVLVGKIGRGARQLDLVGAEHAFKGRAEAGAGTAIVDFAGGAHAGQAEAGAADLGRASGGLGQAVIAQFIAAQGQAREIDRFGGAGILVDKLRRAGHAQVSATDRIIQGQGRIGKPQLAVIYLAAAQDHAQRARCDGQRGGAGIRDIVFGRPQAAQRIVADIEGIAIAGGAAGTHVAIRQANIAERAGAGHHAVIDFAGRAAGAHLQWCQKSLQHRRGIAVVDAPDGVLAEIEATKLGLLLHLRR